jgi:hypothetical protein
MNSKQAGINANRKHDDPAMREWARGKQRPANAERIQFRNSLTDDDRSQIEERIQQLVDDNPALSSTTPRILDSSSSLMRRSSLASDRSNVGAQSMTAANNRRDQPVAGQHRRFHTFEQVFLFVRSITRTIAICIRSGCESAAKKI